MHPPGQIDRSRISALLPESRPGWARIQPRLGARLRPRFDGYTELAGNTSDCWPNARKLRLSCVRQDIASPAGLPSAKGPARDLEAGPGVVGFFRQKDASTIGLWIQTAERTPLRRFALGLSSDLRAIRAAIELPWSNGPTEDTSTG